MIFSSNVPIVPLGHFVGFLSYFFVTALTYYSYRRRRLKFIRHFLRSFILLTIWFLVVSLPGLFLNNATAVGFAFIVSYILVYTIMGSFILIPLESLDLLKIEKIILFSLMALIIFTVYMGSVYFKPAHYIIQGKFIYWLPVVSPIVRLPIGLAVGVTGIISIASFFMMGVKSGERKIFLRAIILGCGMLSLVLAGTINFIAGATPSSMTFLAATFFAIASAFIFLVGVLYKIKEI